MVNYKELLSLFFSFASVSPDKSQYARQTTQLKKLVLMYGVEEVELMLRYLSNNKGKYNVSSLAYIQYIHDELMPLIWASLVKEEKIEFNDNLTETNNASKSEKFGKKQEEWGDMFATKKR